MSTKLEATGKRAARFPNSRRPREMREDPEVDGSIDFKSSQHHTESSSCVNYGKWKQRRAVNWVHPTQERD
jgi:hypothetical protein